jgi:hypothetical protein
VQTYNLDGKLEVTAYQIGGDASQLAKVFGKCDKAYCLTSCSLNNLDACDGIIGGILSYAQNDFLEQIDLQSGVVLGNAAPISYTMPALSDITSLSIATSVITNTIIAARKFFGELYAKQEEILSFVTHALDFPESNYIPNDIALQNLQLTKHVLENNIALLESAGLTCYSDPTKCEEIKHTIVGELKDVKLSID